MERDGGEIGQRLLELAEGDRRLIKVVAVARRLETEAAGDIIIGPPEFPLCVDGIFSAALAVQRRIISSPVFFFAIKRETASIFSISSSGCRNATRLMRWSV